MTSNIDMLNRTFKTNQFGFIKIIHNYVTNVERMCDGYYCDQPAHPYWEEVDASEIIASGLLRNYTVRQHDILLTVLPWDKKSESFLDKRQLKFENREDFYVQSGSLYRDGASIVWLGKRRQNISIDLARWEPRRMW